MTNRFVVDALTQCTMQLGNNFVKEKKLKFYLILLGFFLLKVCHNMEESHTTLTYVEKQN